VKRDHSWAWLALVLVFLAGNRLPAEPPEPGSSAWSWKYWCHPGLWGPWSCPDDYCRKPPPLVDCPKWCGPDDYCRKPPPVVGCPKWCGPNDYLPKPPPCVGPPLVGSWYRCGPGDDCAGRCK